MKKIEKILAPQEFHYVGDGFRVATLIPEEGLSRERMDPFLLLDYNPPFRFAPSSHPRGVGFHPHRGFETVTIAYQGKVAHQDNHGGGGVIGPGEVQWMTAASGVLHQEFHEAEWASKGGVFQMIQLWVNLSKKDKMSQPKYQVLSKDSIALHKLATGGVIEVIAGQYQDTQGTASTFSSIHLMNAKLQSGESTEFSFPAHFTTALLVIQGSIALQEQTISANQFVVFENEGENFDFKALEEDTIVFVMSGEPLKEPIVAYGPFVMNSPEEIQQAYQDFYGPSAF